MGCNSGVHENAFDHALGPVQKASFPGWRPKRLRVAEPQPQAWQTRKTGDLRSAL